VTDPAPATRGAVAAWGFWDWVFSAFNAVATTFVFSTYLSGKALGDPAHESELLPVKPGDGLATPALEDITV
jgi:UMF1 family MFS transporter